MVSNAIVSHGRYNEMIFEAISTMKDTNGCDIGAISQFVEVSWMLLLSAKVKALIEQHLTSL